MADLSQVWQLLFRFISNTVLFIQNNFYPLKQKELVSWQIFCKNRGEISPVEESSFVCHKAQPKLIQAVLEPSYIPIEYKSNRAVFLKCSQDVYNTEKYPFFYHALYLNAEEKAVTPLKDFLDLVDDQPWPDVKLVFLWSVGRCGSTLLANLFTSFDGFRTISEPDDMFMAYGRKEQMGSETYHRVMRNSLKFHMIQLKSRYPDTKCIIIKPRSMGFWYITKLPVEVRENTTNIFMYRDVIPTLKSFVKSFGDKAPSMDSILAKIANLEGMVKGAIGPLESTLEKMGDVTPQIEEASKIRNSSNHMLVRMIFGGLPYLILLYKQLLKTEQFATTDGSKLFAVKYERLIADPKGQFEIIAEKSNFKITEHEREKILELSKKDSQANSALSQKTLSGRKSDDIPKEVSQKFQEIFSACNLEDEIESGYLLPNTV